MTHVPVSESVLRWAIQRTGNPDAIESKFPKLPEWLKGESHPTLRQLEEFAKATCTPLGYLFLQAPPEERLPIPYFRTEGDDPLHRPSSDLIETVQIMERRRDWLREYLIEQGEGPLRFVRSARLRDSSKRIAEDIRQVLGIEEEWASDYSTWTDALRALMNKVDDVGILLTASGVVGNNTHRKLTANEFRGFVLVDEYAPLIFINSSDGKAAQMFTVAHELAHIWFGSSAAFDLRELQPANDATEQACNRVAAEFLVSEARLRAIWPSVQEEQEPFQSIARQFKVSVLVAARRALDLNLITKNEFFEFYRTYTERESNVVSAHAGGNFYATQNRRVGRRFGETVIRAVHEGRLLYRDAYKLTGLYGKSFDQFATILTGRAHI